MSEKHHGFESDSGDEDKKKKAESGHRFELPTRPLPRIQKSAGDTPLKFGEDFLHPKPLEHELFKKPEQAPAEKPEHQDARPAEPTSQGEQLHQISAEDLRARAAQEQLDQLHMLQKLQGEDIDPNEEEKNKKRRLGGAAVAPQEPKLETSQANPSAEQQKLAAEEERTKESETPEQSRQTEAAARENLPEIPQENQANADDEIFRAIARNETGSDPGQAALHELAPGEEAQQTGEVGSFDQWLQGHPELSSLASTPNAAASTGAVNVAPTPGRTVPIAVPVGARGANPHAMQGYANAGNQAPNWPPYNQSGNPNLPPFGPNNPGNGGGNFNGPPQNPNLGNPGFPNQPPNPNNVWAPGGNALNPAVWAGMSALAAHQQLNSLRHTAREIGLAGAVGVLGLGLVAEHIAAKRRDKKLKHQINQQGAALNRTNTVLQREQLAHQNTRGQLERLAAAHNTQTSAGVAERMMAARQIETPVTLTAKSAEFAAGTGLISAAAVSELAANVARSREGTPTMNDRHLAKQLERNRRLGKAIRRNPELRDTFRYGPAGQVARGSEYVLAQPGAMLPAAVERQSETIAQERRKFQEMIAADAGNLGTNIERPQRADTSEATRELVTANAANVVLDETRHERLGAQTTDVTIFTGVASANGASDASLAALSVPIPFAKAPNDQPITSQIPLAVTQQNKSKKIVSNPWVWATTVLVFAAAIITAMLVS